MTKTAQEALAEAIFAGETAEVAGVEAILAHLERAGYALVFIDHPAARVLSAEDLGDLMRSNWERGLAEGKEAAAAKVMNLTWSHHGPAAQEALYAAYNAIWDKPTRGEVLEQRALVQFAESLTKQDCPNGKHASWYADTEFQYACPWCELDRVTAGFPEWAWRRFKAIRSEAG